jgi:hypothetical protein
MHIQWLVSLLLVLSHQVCCSCSLDNNLQWKWEFCLHCSMLLFAYLAGKAGGEENLPRMVLPIMDA